MDATLMWIDAERGGDSRLSWSNLSRYRASQDDIPVLAPDFLSYGDYDNSGVEERSNVRSIQRDFPDTADADSVWWEVVGDFGSHALVLRLPPTITRWMEAAAFGRISPSTGLRFPFSTSNEREVERWGALIRQALIDRMWSRCHRNLPSDQWDNAASVLETLEEHLTYDEDDSYRMQEEMVEEAWKDWAWDDFKRDLTDTRRNLLPALWSDNLLECLDTVLESVKDEDAGGVLAWLTADGDLDHGVEGGGNVYFRWEKRLTEVWEQFEDHGTLPWDAAEPPQGDPAQLQLEV